MTTLVVGAGVCGLTAARELRARGHQVVVADKGRGPGGRVSTRRATIADAPTDALASLAFDHGAQYFTVRDARFAAEVGTWADARVAQRWHGTLASFDSEGREAVDDGVERWVGAPGMSAIGRHLADGLDMRQGHTVTALERRDGLWQAACREGRVLTGFDALIVAVPAPQAAPLVRAWPALAAHAASVTMRPCWAVMAAFAARVPTAFDGAFVSASPLAWIARDRSKPRRGFAETWVLHASTTWSEAHLADPPDAVAAFLVNAFADLVRGPLPVPALVAAHRWRYAVADPPLAAGPLADADARLVVTGDWCLGKRIEDAFLAGLAAVARLS